MSPTICARPGCTGTHYARRSGRLRARPRQPAARRGREAGAADGALGSTRAPPRSEVPAGRGAQSADAPADRAGRVAVPERPRRRARGARVAERPAGHRQDLVGRGDGGQPRHRPDGGRHLASRLEVDWRDREASVAGVRRGRTLAGHPAVRRGGRVVRQAHRRLGRARSLRQPGDRLSAVTPRAL